MANSSAQLHEPTALGMRHSIQATNILCTGVHQVQLRGEVYREAGWFNMFIIPGHIQTVQICSEN